MDERQEKRGDWQAQAEEYLNGWKRAQADLINYKKDETKRFHEIIKFANEALIRDLLNVLDSFDLALTTLEKTEAAEAKRGIYLIKNQLENILKDNGLEIIIVSVGERFNPAVQEAIAVVDSDKESGIVLEVISNGYLLNGKLIRPARVKVSK